MKVEAETGGQPRAKERGWPAAQERGERLRTDSLSEPSEQRGPADASVSDC